MPTKPLFARKLTKAQKNFSGGLNNKFSSLLIADNELADLQNMNFFQKGTLRKRKGFVKHYPVQFGSKPVRGLYNYRKENGTSRLVIGTDDKLYYDTPQFVKLWDLEIDWEEVGSTRTSIDTTSVPGDLRVAGIYEGFIGAVTLGEDSAMLGGPSASTITGIWVSAPLDITNISNQGSGVVTDANTVPAGTTRLIETRTAATVTMAGASAYAGLGAGGSVVSPGNNFIQIRLTMTTPLGITPSIQSLQITFDNTPAVTQLTSGLDTLARYSFTTQNDILWIVNGVNPNMKWDATTFGTQGGAPPAGKFIILHKNRQFVAGTSGNRSRLYFSDLQLPESWPALNFIDVGKGDGDSITGLAILNNNLVVFKDNTIWVLQGDAPANFVLRRVVSDSGCIIHQSVGPVPKNALAMLSRDGVRFFDGVRNGIASERIQVTFEGLNQKQLQLAASVYFRNMLYISVPEGTSTNNTTILVFDTLLGAWTIYRGIPAGEFVIWRKFNQDVLMFGSSLIGQLYDMETGYNDDGASIDAYFLTKAFDFGGPERVKRVRNSFVDVAEPSLLATTCDVSFVADNATPSATITLSLAANRALNILRAIASIVGISVVRTLSVKVRHNVVDKGFSCYGVTVQYVPSSIRETT